MSPSGRPPLAIKYWFISTVSAAQIGAAWEVPAPTYSFCAKMNLTPVNGSPTAATSGDNLRRAVSRSTDSVSCHSGRANSSDTPPLVP